MNNVILYCYPGFEKKYAAEITEKTIERELYGERKLYGFTHVNENSGYMVFVCYEYEEADRLICTLPLSSLIFAHQMILTGDLLHDLSTDDRIIPIVGMLTGAVAEAEQLFRSKSQKPMKAKSHEVL